jgi:hypothetical protein
MMNSIYIGASCKSTREPSSFFLLFFKYIIAVFGCRVCHYIGEKNETVRESVWESSRAHNFTGWLESGIIQYDNSLVCLPQIAYLAACMNR